MSNDTAPDDPTSVIVAAGERGLTVAEFQSLLDDWHCWWVEEDDGKAGKCPQVGLILFTRVPRATPNLKPEA